MEYPREQLKQVFLQLPADLKSALFSEINAVFIRQIAGKFHLPEEKIPQLAGQVGLVIMGVLAPQNLSSELKTVLNIDGQMSQAITQEVNFKIFTPIRLSLRKIHGLATPEEISEERPMPSYSAPIPAPKPAPPIPIPTPRPVSTPPAPMPARPQAPIPPSRPATPPQTPTAIPPKPITPPTAAVPKPATPPYIPQVSRPIPPSPKPFIPPRPLTPPGIIVPKTITPPSSTYQRPAYESPALSPKPITPPVAPPPPAGGPPKPITPPSIGESRPITPPQAAEPAIAGKPEISAPAEPIDLTKININDLKGNIVDLKNLE